ncbi:MAG: hypothetical protein IH934_00575 [Nanoarchaeota archaeon]|nr:hypothetical protein [Nanoarchaeota archaeon]
MLIYEYQRLGSRLGGLRKSRRLNRRQAAEYIHSRFSGVSVTTFVDDIRQYENGLKDLELALSGEEPYITSFRLYIEAMNLSEQEKQELSSLIKNPEFSYEINEKSLARGRNIYRKRGSTELGEAINTVEAIDTIVEDLLPYAQNIPDVGYDIKQIELIDDKLRIAFQEPDVLLEDAVLDFEETINKQKFPYPMQLDFSYEGNFLVISPSLEIYSIVRVNSISFLKAYKTVLEQRN